MLLPGTGATPRWKSLLVLCCAIYPLSNLIGLAFHPLIKSSSPWVSSLIVVPITLVVVTYLVLPWATRLLAPWLQRGATDGEAGKQAAAAG